MTTTPAPTTPATALFCAHADAHTPTVTTPPVPARQFVIAHLEAVSRT
jgi:hypothetical protein